MSICAENSENPDYVDALGLLKTATETLIGMLLVSEAERIANRDSISVDDALTSVLESDFGKGAGRIFGAVGVAVDSLATVANATANGGDVADYTREISSMIGGILGASIGGAIATSLMGAAAVSLPALGLAVVGSIVGAAAATVVHDLAREAYCEFVHPTPSPLILDLDGDGVELTSINGATAHFDIDADGFSEFTGWVSSDDGLLALDINGNGKIDDGSELFGDQSGHAHGFLALAAHDDNLDGAIDAADAVFANLVVWQDLNADGVSQSDELRTLSEVGISSISVNATATDYQVAGNDILWESTFTWSDGTVGAVADAFFQIDPIKTKVVVPEGFEFNEQVFNLPFLQGAGHLANTWYALTVDAALRTQAVALVAQASSGDISGFRTAFNDFVMDWAGVGDVPVTGRGDMNGQHLAFLEAMFDQPFTQAGGSNPGMFAAEDLGAGVHQLIDAMAAEFLSQVAVSDALLNSTDTTQFEQVLAANPFNGFTGDLSQAEDTINLITWQVEQGLMTISNAATTLNLWRAANSLDAEQANFYLDSAWGSSSSGSGLGWQPFGELVRMYFSSDKLYIGGTSGDDVLTSIGTGATIAGNGGDDVLLGAYGSDIYVYRDGDGSDLIVDNGWDSDPDKRDIFRFMDAEVDEVKFSHNAGGDLTITTTDGSVIVITDHFSNTTYQIEYIDFGTVFFTDGTEEILVSAEALDLQAIRNKSVADQVSSGFVRGSQGREDYYHAQGDGSYTIYDYGYLSDAVHNDVLTFTDLNVSDVQFGHNAGGDLIISTAAGDVITVTDHFANTSFDIETISFLDGSLGLQAIRNKSVADQVATGFVRGSQFREDYFHAQGDGSYTIYDYGYLSDAVNNDVLTFTDLNVSDVQFGHNAGGDLIATTAAGDVITVTNHFANTSFDIETISFLDGNLGLQAIRNKSVSDQIATGFVRGSQFREDYSHALGDGSYTIYDYGYLSAAVNDDVLTFTDLNATDVQFGQNTGGDLIISTAAGDVITVTDHFSNASFDIETISFLDGSLGLQAIRNKSVADQVSTGFVRGTHEREYYYHSDGDGSYTIYDYGWSSNSNRTDLFSFSDLNSDQVSFEQNWDGDLIMKTTGGDVITVTDHFVSTSFDMEQISFADGVVLGLQGIKDKLLQGSLGDDSMIGFSTADTMTGQGGDDYIFGSGGNDVLYGNEGNDELRGGVGDDQHFGGEGNDSIFAWDGNDILYGDAGGDYLDGGNGDDDSFGGDGDDYILGTPGDDFFDGGAGIDTLDFSYTSSAVTFDQLAGTITFANGFVEYFAGFENIITGTGASIVFGNDAANEFVGSTGDDVLEGGIGKDTLFGGEGHDTLRGGAGDDRLEGGGGDDDHFGGDGDDLISGSFGDDYFDGGAGIDTLDFSYSSSGSTINLDTGRITFADGFIEDAINFENAIAGSGSNSLIGNVAANSLEGGGGNDQLTGGASADYFVFYAGSGMDTITDFEDQLDKISFVGSGLSFGDLVISSSGADTTVDYGAGDQILLSGIATGQVTSDDFIFV